MDFPGVKNRPEYRHRGPCRKRDPRMPARRVVAGWGYDYPSSKSPIPEPPMIDLYVWPTPNAFKVSIMLEETETPYRVFPVDIGAGDQFKADFLKISPNNKMPALVDS